MGTMNIINAIKKNDPIALQKELDFLKIATNEDYDLNQVVQKNGQRLRMLLQNMGVKQHYYFYLSLT